MRILLLSTYELGHQPLHIASPIAALRAEGHDVRAIDLSLDPLAPGIIDEADAIAVSVPMHTAMRLASDVVERIRRHTDVPVALYGLYAAMADVDGVDHVIVGEYEQGLIEWAAAGGSRGGTRLEIGRSTFRVPDRDTLPTLDRYAHLAIGGEHRMVGYVEASHGCRHRCRHCPIPVVYDGRYRIVESDVVLADIGRQVAAGARHVTFGDPDFFNGPRHTMPTIEDAHRRFPDVTFDVTIKVEHLLVHSDLVPRLAASGVLFVVSAFESVDERTLRLLAKGHTVDDMVEAIELVRRTGMDIHPSWMPFNPWTTIDDVLAIFRFLSEHDLMGVTDPVQLSIRLLVPPGSLMLEIPDVQDAIGEYDSAALTHGWDAADPAVDRLQRTLATMASRAADARDDPLATLLAMWRHTLAAAGADPDEAQIPMGAVAGRPRLTEPWFC